jgi:hypothetical protein
MGPINHGLCKSIYLAAPEGLQLEFATWTAAIDADRWIDPEVVAVCGIDASDLARYRRPAPFASRGGAIRSQIRGKSRRSSSPRTCGRWSRCSR